MAHIRLSLLLALFVAGCHDFRSDAPPPALPSIAAGASSDCTGTTTSLRVDTAASVVGWLGTKFAGRGKHEGIIRLAGGSLELCDGFLFGGRIALDMRSIEVTDIPETEPVPRARLKTHLMSDDFFAVKTYPEARFEIYRVEHLADDSLQVHGTLTMRGISAGIAFRARVSGGRSDPLQASAQFSLDRQRWGVAYRGDALTNDLVDDDIVLAVRLHAVR